MGYHTKQKERILDLLKTCAGEHLTVSDLGKQLEENGTPVGTATIYRYLEQLKDILPSILLAIFMGCCMWLVNLAHLPDIVTLVIQILIGAAVYLGGSALLKLDTFEYLWNVVKPKIQRKPWADNEE